MLRPVDSDSLDLTARRSDTHGASYWRLILFLALLPIELSFASLLFGATPAIDRLGGLVGHVQTIIHFGIAAFALFVCIAWAKRRDIEDVWLTRIRGSDVRPTLALHAFAFASLLAASVMFSVLVPSAERPQLLFLAFCGPLALNGATLVLVLAPLTFWRDLLLRWRIEVAFAMLASFAMLAVSDLSQHAWSDMAGVTLSFSYALLSTFDSSAFVDPNSSTLGAGSFSVIVMRACSGLEGLGLVFVFVSIYLFIFRSSLRFPNALLLLPIGLSAIWLLNSARIAILVAIGAHVSPAMALEGFHSQAGWIGFLIVAIVIMVGAHRISYFSKREDRPPHRASQSNRRVLGYLAPFMALMASSIVASAFAPHDHWLYALKVAAVAAAIWVVRDAYRGLATQVSAVSIAAGVLVGVIWALTDPNQNELNELGIWLAQQAVPVAAFWLFVRAAGAVVLVPIAEELAFRGYLARALTARAFEHVDPRQMTLVAVVISSALFGLIHDRWLSGALAGAVYAFVMMRTGRVSDAIVAHMASNAVIVAWAILLGQWSLL